MSAREVRCFGESVVEAEARPRYLHVVARGMLASVSEVDEYHAFVEQLMTRWKCRNAVVDVRGQTGAPTPPVRARAWAWLASDRGFHRVAYVVADDGALKREQIDMAGLARGVSIRSFASVTEAHRWLLSSRPSGVITAVTIRPPGSLPPPKS